MPIKNQAIFTVLSEMNANEGTKDAQIAALQALMLAGLDDPGTFRAAVLEHKAVLGAGSPDLFKCQDADGESQDVENNDDFLSADGNDEGQYSLEVLKQQAALKRIQFGLKDLADSDLAGLKELLTLETELGAWFKTKPGFFSDYNWEAEPNFLTDDALGRIRDRAKKLVTQKITTQMNSAIENIDQVKLQIDAALRDFSASRLADVIGKYTRLKEEVIDLTSTNDENQIFLAEEAELHERVGAVVGQFEETTAQLKEAVTTFINSQYEVFAAEEVLDENATSAELASRLNLLNTRFESVEQALLLAEMVKDEEEEAAEAADPLADPRRKKAEMQRALIFLNVLTSNKLALEKVALIDANATAISQYNGTGSERARLLSISEAAFTTIQEQADASAEKATIAAGELYARFETERARIIALNATTQAALQTAETHLKFSRLLTELPNQPRHFGTTFVDRGRETFDTVVVKKGTPPPEGVVRPTAGALAVHVGHVTTQPTYQRVKLEPGDAIYSTIAFPRAPAGAAAPGKVTVQLIQDHKGIVTRHTDGRLDAEESLTAAIRQAELLLNNYESGDIILTGAGHNAAHAKILVAVLLVLKQNCPALAAAKIVSEVAGCDVPKPAASSKWNFLGKAETQATVNQRFIETALPARVANEPKIQRLAQQINQFIAVKETNKQAFSDLKQEIQQARGANLEDADRRIKAVPFNENEEVALDGTRSPIIVRR